MIEKLPYLIIIMALLLQSCSTSGRLPNDCCCCIRNIELGEVKPIKKIKYNESHINTNHYYINDSAFEMLKNIKGSCGDFQCGKRHGLILDIAYQYSRRGVGILGDSSATMTRYYLVLHYALRKDEDNSHILHSGSITDVNSFRSSESIYGYIKASEDIQNILAISAFRKLQMHIVSLCKESRFS